MKNLEYLVGSEDLRVQTREPYSKEVCDFLNDLSTYLMHNSEVKQNPDVLSFAFFCRKANIQRLKERFNSKSYRLGRGLVFHIAPSNVPVNFAFSFIFSLLAGNSNIVRVPSKQFRQVELICNAINEVLANGYDGIREGNAFVRYAADNSITQEFSKIADARVIWGGDETVASIRKLDCKPRCVDIAFADRYSICFLNGNSILSADDTQIARLAQNFYNDTYLMDQNACSSPKIVFWEDDSIKARERFWEELNKIVTTKYELQAAVAIDKYSMLCQDAIELDFKTTRLNNYIYRLELQELPNDLTRLNGKAGYFFEYSLNQRSEIITVLSEKIQTITYFGLNPDELTDFLIKNKVRGVDRIVPVGKALDIGVIWDGYDLVDILSRQIVCVEVI